MRVWCRASPGRNRVTDAPTHRAGRQAPPPARRPCGTSSQRSKGAPTNATPPSGLWDRERRPLARHSRVSRTTGISRSVCSWYFPNVGPSATIRFQATARSSPRWISGRTFNRSRPISAQTRSGLQARLISQAGWRAAPANAATTSQRLSPSGNAARNAVRSCPVRAPMVVNPTILEKGPRGPTRRPTPTNTSRNARMTGSPRSFTPRVPEGGISSVMPAAPLGRRRAS